MAPVTDAHLRQYQNASDQAMRDHLVLDHLGLVKHISRRLVGTLPDDVDFENLEQAGVLGLVEAASQYNPDRGIAFSTYAYSRIRGAIIDELRRNSPLSRKILQKLSVVREACERLEPPVTLEAVAKLTGFTVDDVEECLEASRLTRATPFEEGISAAANHDHSANAPTTRLERDEMQQVLAGCIELLPERERIALTCYHLEELRLKEIGAVMGISESRASRLLSRAEFHLSELVRARGV